MFVKPGFLTGKMPLSFAMALSIGLTLGQMASALPPPVVAQTEVPTNPAGLITPTTTEQLPMTPKKERGTITPEQPEEVTLPSAPETAPMVGIQRSDFKVDTIHVEGNTVVSNADIAPLTAQYEGRMVTLDELGKLVSAINKLYYEKGYYTSQAYIPPQDVDQGSLTIKVMEGRIGHVDVTGNRFLKASVVQRDLGEKEGSILNAKELEAQLRRISSQSDVYKMKAVLTAGKETGQTDIELQVKERYPLQITPTFDNQGRPYIGTYRWGVNVESPNITGHGDRLNVGWIGAAHTQIATGSYFIPVNRFGTELGATFAASRVNLDLPKIRNQEQIIGRSLDYSAVIIQPLDRDRHFTADASLNFRRIFTTVGGDWDHEGTDRIAAMRFGLNYNNYDRYGRTYLRAETSVAPGWMGANRKFWKSNFYATRLVTLPYRNLLILRGSAQMSPDGLPTAEMMQIGGAYSVRGYTEGLLIGDRGYNFTIEHRWPIPGLSKLSPKLADNVRGATFFDMGNVWTDRSNGIFVEGQSNNRSRRLLAGAGVGLRFRLSRLLIGFADMGWGLTDRGDVEPNAQPSFRVHFGFRSNLLPEDYRDWTASEKTEKKTAYVPPLPGMPGTQPPFISPLRSNR